MDRYHSPFLKSSDENSHDIASHLFAIVFCYLVGTLGLSVFFIVPVLLLLWMYWEERCRLFTWITELRTEHRVMRLNVIKSGESANWINHIIDSWWTCCSATVTDFVKDWVEPIVNKFRFPSVVAESIKILSFSTGPHRIKFSNVKLMQPVVDTNKPSLSRIKQTFDYNDLSVFVPMTMDKLVNPPVAMVAEGHAVMALEADVELTVPRAEFKMKAGVGIESAHHNFALNIESFDISGRFRCVVTADRNAPFPHVATTDLCFVTEPKINVQVRILKDKLEVSNTPGLKAIMEKFISYGFQRLLVYPGKQHIDFTPTPLPGPEWEQLRGCGLSQGVLTVQVECENIDGIKKNLMSSHYCKLSLGVQKCIRDFTDGSLAPCFSFLIHDPTKDKLRVKLKGKRKVRRDVSVAKRVIHLQSLGIFDRHSISRENDSEKTQVRMSSKDGSIQLCLSFFYTPLPQFSLLQHTPALSNCNAQEAGVLYIHVHGAKNLYRRSSPNTGYDPYCVVRKGEREIFRTSCLSNTADPVWEKGKEILVPSCHDVSLLFEIYHNSHTLASHNLIAFTNVNMNTGKTQLIQHKLLLSNTEGALLASAFSLPSLYVSVVFRNVETVNWTRDSLQEAYIVRTHRQSTASCLDITSKFLNPVTQSLGSFSAVADVGDDLSLSVSSSDESEASSNPGPLEFNRRMSMSESYIAF